MANENVEAILRIIFNKPRYRECCGTVDTIASVTRYSGLTEVSMHCVRCRRTRWSTARSDRCPECSEINDVTATAIGLAPQLSATFQWQCGHQQVIGLVEGDLR